MASKILVIDCKPNSEPQGLECPLTISMTIECLDDYLDDITWAVTFVGSPSNKTYDQVLTKAAIGPLRKDVYTYTIEAPSPDMSKVPVGDILGMTILFINGAWKDQEFIRIGYYIHTYYEDMELREDPPDEPNLAKLKRVCLLENPRITRFGINWSLDSPEETYLMREDAGVFGDEGFDVVGSS